MSQEPLPKGVEMPRALDLFLTNRVLCAVLAVWMLTAVYWVNILFGNLGLIAFVLLIVGVLLHLIVPSLFALISLGGGVKFSLQTGAIAAVLLLLLLSGSVSTVVVFMLLFVLLPVFAAQTMQRKGLGQAGWVLALVLFVGFASAMVVGASPQGLEVFVQQQFKPVFDEMIAGMPAGANADIAAMQNLQVMMVKVFPGFFILGLWFIWWTDLIYARNIAQKYGFYQGDEGNILSFSLPSMLAYVLLILLGVANLAAGDLQYIALSGVIVLAGLAAVQGVVVVHAWFKSKEMANTIIVMYVMLFFWSFVVVVFSLIGLLDMWFNFRRKFISATGEK
ncbi:MAG TPA: DUF2232 domain-containing protein [Ghiorsea sp.]|nr:DUF2232 domain-containing protein [Ghiorsea sp.]